MARVTAGPAIRKRRNKVLKQARGYFGARHRLFRVAKESLAHAWEYAFAGRKIKKRDFRSLWITRINAGLDPLGLSYSRFIAGLKSADIQLDRRVLADLALHDPAAFGAVAEAAKQSLS